MADLRPGRGERGFVHVVSHRETVKRLMSR